MSWNNVKGVSSAKIWTDNPDMTQAYLFANGNHQVKLTAAVSFTLTDATQSGPTEDEVKTALSLIDFETGAGISRLNTGDKGQYSYVYLPSMPTVIKAIEASDVGSYQYEFDYYVSSDDTINASYASEKVALFLSYTSASGSKVEYNTASGSKSQSYVAVTVYPPKKYDVAGSSSTPVIIHVKDDRLEYSNVVNSGTVSNESVASWSLRIDDGYFRIKSLQSSDAQDSLPFARHAETASGYENGWSMAETFFPSENEVDNGRASYSAYLSITYDDPDDYFFHVNATVHQEANEIIFIYFKADYSNPKNEGFREKEDGTASLTAFDQFGNKFSATVSKTSGGLNITSVI